MANLSEDIQCAGFDTQPPMLDRTALHPVNNVFDYIVRETLTEGASYLGPERPRVYSDLSPEEKDRYNADIMATNILLQGLPKDIYTLINHYTDANDIWDNVKMLLEDKMLLMQAQENGVALVEEQILFLPDDYDAFDFDVDEAPTAQTMFMANLSSADHDAICEHHEEHEMHDNVQPNHIVDSHADYMSDSSMILLYKQDQSLQIVHMLCKPKPYYNELNKVAIGYNNPLCLTRAKQVQPAPYNGHEIIKNNHVPAIVHNTEDTLEIVEIIMREMNDKMKDPECVNHKVKIAPHDYSNENFLAPFTPQKQLTSEQIFWSQDLIKMKTEALKEQTTASRPIKALTVKHDEIERKNLLIVNDNLIAEWLSKEVFYVATNFELNVSRFTEMHVANTIVEARCLELKVELSNLRDKSHNDNHN
nr:hypothetical protein [Tanacetum cinerariifolium]